MIRDISLQCTHMPASKINCCNILLADLPTCRLELKHAPYMAGHHVMRSCYTSAARQPCNGCAFLKIVLDNLQSNEKSYSRLYFLQYFPSTPNNTPFTNIY